MNNKILIQLNEMSYTRYDFSSESWQIVSATLPKPTEQEFIDNGVDPSDIELTSEEAWKELSGQEIKLFYYTDNLSTEEITIETEVEPYDIYDEFGDSMEVLYYTDGPDKTKADLEITANYSPLDEIEEDFEVVTWTDEENAERTLNMNAIPKPHLIKQINPTLIESDIDNYLVDNANKPSKMFLLSSDKSTWKKWNGTSFEVVSVQDETIIPDMAMTSDTLSSITMSQWNLWNSGDIYLGIYLDEGDVVDKITYNSITPKESTEISDARLYILNTVSTINVTFAGSTLSGTIDDEDEGKVQYRVILNGSNFFPSDGSFTPLKASPLDIDLSLTNKDYLIDQQNTIRVEFKDYWGTVDYWEDVFVGSYSGILFTDIVGEYYSTEIGEVLKKLDFGIVIAGQTTTEQEIKLKNTYGYPIKNIKLYTKDGEFPRGMSVQFGSNLTSFEGTKELHLNTSLEDKEEVSFYVRLSTKLGITPPSSGDFDIIVVADRDDK